MIIRNVQKLALYPGHFKLTFFFAAELAIALLGVLFDRIYTNVSNIVNNLHIYQRKKGKKWGWKGGINRYLSELFLCVILITRLLQLMGRLNARKLV